MCMWPQPLPWRTIIGRCWQGVFRLPSNEVLGRWWPGMPEFGEKSFFTERCAIMLPTRRVALDTRVVFGFNLEKRGAGRRVEIDAGRLPHNLDVLPFAFVF